MDVPWAAAGTVTVTNGGDVFKEADLIPPSATQPVTEQQASGLPYASVSILSLNAVDGTSIYDDTTWIMGEISNTGNANAYDVTISGLLKDAQGSPRDDHRSYNLEPQARRCEPVELGRHEVDSVRKKLQDEVDDSGPLGERVGKTSNHGGGKQ